MKELDEHTDEQWMGLRKKYSRMKTCLFAFSFFHPVCRHRRSSLSTPTATSRRYVQAGGPVSVHDAPALGRLRLR